MITITLNGEPTEIPERLNLATLIAHLHLPSERVAIEHNRRIAKRKDWPSMAVNEGDVIEIVHLVGGG